MSWMGKTEQNWNGLKFIGFLKTVQPNSLSKLISGLFATSKIMLVGDIFSFLESLLVSFTSNFFAYVKFHSDWGRVTGKIKQNELDYRDTAPLNNYYRNPTPSPKSYNSLGRLIKSSNGGAYSFIFLRKGCSNCV